ncbi:MAG: DUF1588 domain-containing protein, partial [Lentisphaeraceae bacterium]|nr:DUF1588 domain-containing protein [Lentisphaeraceae bacterium]
YGYTKTSESGLDFHKVKHEAAGRGGLLTQAGILAGLSDGSESNPVKRGAWFARKIIGLPPGPPPPNVPELDPKADKNLTLREKLEKHRNQKGCVKCHRKIDPWGIPFEMFDAAGFIKDAKKFDASSKLPGGKEIKSFADLKDYLLNDEFDQVAYSFIRHLSVYAVGRNLSFTEVDYLKENCKSLKADGYRMQDIIKFVVNSDMFLKK